ncbi:MAG: transcription antitermination factor NusB [Planctomycetota bacterium]|jgi:transcription antitermination factor NusB
MQQDKRTRARELAMQALYQLDIQGSDLIEFLSQFFTENEADEYICRLASDWTQGTWENLPRCDELIAASTIKWQLSRLSLVDKSILRLAVYQLEFCPDIPPRVIINEAIELAKKFSSGFKEAEGTNMSSCLANRIISHEK